MTEGMRITRGTPTDEEVAALVAALLTLPTGAPAAPPAMSRWACSARPQSRMGPRGRDAWRAAGLPRAR